MKPRALISIAMILFVWLLVSFPLAAQEGNKLSAAPRKYTLQVLPGPPGLTGLGNAVTINDRGWVTGLSNPSDDSYDTAVLWRHGQATNLGNLAGKPGYNSAPGNNNINDTGWVVGGSETGVDDPNYENFGQFTCLPTVIHCAPNIIEGFLWQSTTNTMIALPSLVPPQPEGGGNNSVALGANNQEIIGYAENGVYDPTNCVSPQVYHYEGVVWKLGPDGTPFVSRRLSPVADDTVSAAIGINEGGDIVGASAPCGFGFIPTHAVLWKKDGSVIDLGNLGGATTLPSAINNQGQVVGNSVLSDDLTPRAFLWQEGSGMQDLGALPGDDQSGASAINDSGEVVGVSCNSATGNCRSFHWQRGVMTDISALPAVSRLLGVTANDINSRGEIAIAANDPTVTDPSTGSPLQIPAVLIPEP